MAKIAAVGLPADQVSNLAELLGDDDLVLDVAEDGAGGLALAKEEVEFLDVLVLGELLTDPITLAQNMHVNNRGLAIIMLCSPARHKQFKQEIQFNPFLGRDVNLVSANSIPLLAETLTQAVLRSQKRRDHGMAMRSIMTGLKLSRPAIVNDSYLDRLLDHAPLGVLTVDEVGSIVSLNRFARNLLNRNEPGFIGQHAYSLFPKRYQESFCDLLKPSDKLQHEHAALKVYLENQASRCLAVTIEPFQLRSGAPGNLVLIVDITERERTAELDEYNKQLQQEIVSGTQIQEELRLAEEVATAVIHNIGNVVNSVNVSSTIMLDTLKSSKLDLFLRVNQLVVDNMGNLADFLTRDPRGLKVPESYLRVGMAMKKEHQTLIEEVNGLQKKIELIKDVTTSQQALASGKLSEKEALLNDLIHETLKIQTRVGQGGIIDVQLDLENGKGVRVPNLKMAHVLMNIIKNAREALGENDPGDRKLKLNIRREPLCLFLEIADNGSGIKSKNMGRMFDYGFTTKEHGHGFGLNHCAHVMREMGGDISVTSQGKGKGAQFTLRIPLHE